MAEPFLGQITMFGGNFAPRNWALCDGQLLPIAQNTALFSLLGTIYGGDGQTTFGLPDLKGRSPMHAGNGAGLTPRSLGQKSGAETSSVTLAEANLPPLTLDVSIKCNSGDGDQSSPVAGYPALSTEDVLSYNAAQNGVMAADVASASGGGASVPVSNINNMAPFQVVNFIIALQGLYPSRN